MKYFMLLCLWFIFNTFYIRFYWSEKQRKNESFCKK